MSDSKLEYLIDKLSLSLLSTFENELKKSKSKRFKDLLILFQHCWKRGTPLEELLEVLYPQREFSDRHFRNLRWELYQRLKQFCMDHLFGASPEMSMIEAKTLLHHKAHRYVGAVLDKTQSQIEEMGEGLEMMDFGLRLQSLRLRHQRTTQGRSELPLSGFMKQSEEVFVARLLYLSLAHRQNQKFYHSDPTPSPYNLFDAVLQQLGEQKWQDSLLIRIYYAAYLLESQPENPEHFYSLQNLLLEKAGTFTRFEAHQLFTLATNHCLSQLNKGEGKYLLPLFSLLKEMLVQKLLVENERINPWHFKTICNCALRLSTQNHHGKIDYLAWTEKFIEDYQGALPEEFKAGLLHFCKGLLFFYKGQYAIAESQFYSSLEDKMDPFLGFDTRSYLLRIYYETENENGMTSLLHSWRMQLARHKKLHPDRLHNYIQFNRFFRRLISLPPGNLKRIQRFKKDLDSLDHFGGRDWFEQKLEELL